MTRLDDIRRQVAQVPETHGVYMWKDNQGDVIYVGKAKQLRSRMRQYVNLQDERAKIALLVDSIASFEYVVTQSEHESLVLEKNLIDQHEPYFNASFKDDKSYPFIALTTSDPFPAIKFTREKHRKGVTYIGPFTDSRAARKLIEVARKVAPICAASCPEWRRMQRMCSSDTSLKGSKRGVSIEYGVVHLSRKACFDYHVGIGPGACCGAVAPDEYQKNIKRVERFLKGYHTEFVNELEDEMEQAAQDLDFERAARIKSRIQTIESVSMHQHVVSSCDLNVDVIGFFREETIAGVHVLMVREGRVVNSNEFVLDKGKDVPDQDLLHSFLLRYYGSTTSIPHEVVCALVPEDQDTMEAWLTEKLDSKHFARVRFSCPKRGGKRKLLDMAQVNAGHALARYKVRTNYEDTRINDALLQLESALALDSAPMRIECFDISTFHGSYTVASMVVFTNGRPDKNQYRRFKVKTQLDEANDFLSMQEVLGRRYAPKRLDDKRFGSRPDLLILDGGKPQLAAAMQVLNSLGLDIPVAGLAKRDEELFVPWQDSGPVVLPAGSSSLYLVKHVRDEAHRFAIAFHRELRGRGMTTSVLDDVAGIGPVRKKALLKHFRSFRNLREATLDQIKASKTVPDEVAEELFAVLRQYNSARSTTSGKQE